MRLILATPIYPPEVGGPATYTVELAERLRGMHEVVIVAYADDAQAVPSTTLIQVSKKQSLPMRLFKYYRILLKEASKADLIYVQNAVAAGLPAVLVGMRLKKPVILKFVGDEAWERATQAGKTKKLLEEFYISPEGGLRTKIFMSIQRFVLNRASIVTTPSAYLGELIVKYYGVPRERVVTNYNAVDVPIVVAGERKPHQILTGVRLATWKNVAGIVRATALLKDKFPDVSFVIAGEGPERKNLEELIEKLDVKDRVHFFGRVSKEKMRILQAESGVHILNSWYEGMPFGVLEGFSMHAPTVATNIPGTNEAVINEQTGLLVPVKDDTALASAIERLFTDSALREKVVEGGSHILNEKFSWNIHLAKFEEMCKVLTAK
jgi:glycosyltransferase involved in cell wall biosynthesis